MVPSDGIIHQRSEAWISNESPIQSSVALITGEYHLETAGKNMKMDHSI